MHVPIRDYLAHFLKCAEKEGFWNCPEWIKEMEIIAWNISQELGEVKAFEVWNTFAPHECRKYSEFFKDVGVTPEELTEDEKRVVNAKRGIGCNFGEPNFNPFWAWKFARPTQSKVFLEKEAKKRREKAEEYNKKWDHLTRKMQPQRYWGD